MPAAGHALTRMKVEQFEGYPYDSWPRSFAWQPRDRSGSKGLAICLERGA